MKTTRFSHLALALLAGSAIAACAAAQSATVTQSKEPPKAAKLKGSLDKPIGQTTTSRTTTHDDDDSVHVTMSVTGDDGSYNITINNDEISAEANGQPVPADRIVRKDNVVILKDEKGKTIKTFDVGVVPGHRGAYLLRGPEGGAATFTPFQGGQTWTTGGQGWRPAEGSLNVFGAPSEPPPVMVGITMSDPDPTLLEHMGLDAGSAFMIDRVIDGLPAKEAGVKPFDLVIQIDGKKPATQEKFREALKDKKAGDKLSLTLLSKGKEHEVTLKLVAYDSSKFGEGQTPMGLGGRAEGDTQRPTLNWWTNQGATAEARKQIEEALKSIKENPDLQPERIKKRTQEALEQALKALEESKETLGQRLYQYRAQRPGQADVIIGDRPGQVFAVPGQPGPAAGAQPDRDMGRRIERLTDMLERLDKRLDDIEKRLDKTGR